MRLSTISGVIWISASALAACNRIPMDARGREPSAPASLLIRMSDVFVLDGETIAVETGSGEAVLVGPCDTNPATWSRFEMAPGGLHVEQPSPAACVALPDRAPRITATVRGAELSWLRVYNVRPETGPADVPTGVFVPLPHEPPSDRTSAYLWSPTGNVSQGPDPVVAELGRPGIVFRREVPAGAHEYRMDLYETSRIAWVARKAEYRLGSLDLSKGEQFEAASWRPVSMSSSTAVAFSLAAGAFPADARIDLRVGELDLAKTYGDYTEPVPILYRTLDPRDLAEGGRDEVVVAERTSGRDLTLSVDVSWRKGDGRFGFSRLVAGITSIQMAIDLERVPHDIRLSRVGGLLRLHWASRDTAAVVIEQVRNGDIVDTYYDCGPADSAVVLDADADRIGVYVYSDLASPKCPVVWGPVRTVAYAELPLPPAR